MFFGSVGATYNVSNQEAPTELGYSLLNDFYKQDALTEQKEKRKKMCTHDRSKRTQELLMEAKLSVTKPAFYKFTGLSFWTSTGFLLPLLVTKYRMMNANNTVSAVSAVLGLSTAMLIATKM